MKSECKPKKSLIGGFCGGLIGCFVGILCKSDWLAMILFFVLGFIGYDFKEFIAVSVKIIKSTCHEIKDCFKFIYKEIIKPNLSYFSYLHIIIIPCFFLFFFAIFNEGVYHEKSFSSLITNLPNYFMANWQWASTGINPLYTNSEYNLDSFIRKLMCYSAFGMSVLLGCMFSFILVVILETIAKCLIHGVRALPKLYRKCKEHYFGLPALLQALIFSTKKIWNATCWCYRVLIKTPILLALIAIYATFGPIVILFKALGLIAIGIHSFRRMACGLSTLAGGIVYLAFIPFAIEGISLGIQAIFFALGCGLVCGLLAAGIDLALDGEKVKSKLDAFMKLSIYKAIPTKIKF